MIYPWGKINLPRSANHMMGVLPAQGAQMCPCAGYVTGALRLLIPGVAVDNTH